MHRWPECPVGEAMIVFLTIKRRQVHEHVSNIPFAHYSGLRTRLGNYLAAPSEPEPLIGLKGLPQCDDQTACCSFCGRIGHRYTVRDNDEARQRSAPICI